MFMQSMVLLVMGFGFVFAFLYAMIAAVSLTTKLLNRFDPPAPEAASKSRKTIREAAPAADDEPTAIAIAVAAERQHQAV
jgi:sodium pump decarboxylases, gamma subunit